MFSATYIGGSMNMAAVTQAVGLDPSLVTASVAADNVVGVLYLAFLALAPSLISFNAGSGAATRNRRSTVTESETIRASRHSRYPARSPAPGYRRGAVVRDLRRGPGAGDVAGRVRVHHPVHHRAHCAGGQLFPRQLDRLKGDYEIGLFLMYLFFAAIGISADVVAMIIQLMEIAVFAAIVIVICHALMIFGLGRVFRTDLMDTVIASNACVAGPATAARPGRRQGQRRTWWYRPCCWVCSATPWPISSALAWRTCWADVKTENRGRLQ